MSRSWRYRQRLTHKFPRDQEEKGLSRTNGTLRENGKKHQRINTVDQLRFVIIEAERFAVAPLRKFRVFCAAPGKNFTN